VLPTAEKRRMVIDAARRFSGLGIDLLKAEFPVNIADESDTAVWAAACRELSEASAVPWVLLSAGVGFDDFARQTAVACLAGCSGVMVGRALWKEALPLWGDERRAFLETTAVDRLQTLANICAAHGRPWTDVGDVTAVAEGWHKTY
jgi:tagatose 1,6-diphosphate aldolase